MCVLFMVPALLPGLLPGLLLELLLPGWTALSVWCQLSVPLQAGSACCLVSQQSGPSPTGLGLSLCSQEWPGSHCLALFRHII